MFNQSDEHVIWACFVKGDKKCFELLYQLHYESLSRYAYKFSQDVLFIEEVIQDLFIKLWNSRENLNRPDSIKYYLFRALKNLIYNKLKSHSREVYMGDSSDLLAFELNVESMFPLDRPDWEELSGKLFFDLTERQKEAIYLLYVEDMSYQEIAELLKIKIGGTYKLIYRAVSKIREKTKDLKVGNQAEMTLNVKADR